MNTVFMHTYFKRNKGCTAYVGMNAQSRLERYKTKFKYDMCLIMPFNILGFPQHH